MDDLLAETKGETVATEAEPGPAPETAAEEDRWTPVSFLPTPIMVSVPLPGFRVRDVLALRPGALLSSSWRGDREVPLACGQVRFAWVEFEVADGVLSVRLTRIAGERN
jgi:hypothetical protein